MIGILSGWFVILFSDIYYQFKETIVNLFKQYQLPIMIIDIFLPVIGFLVMILGVVLGFRVSEKIRKRNV